MDDNSRRIESVKGTMASIFYFGFSTDAYIDQVEKCFTDAFVEVVPSLLADAEECVTNIDKTSLFEKIKDEFGNCINYVSDGMTPYSKSVMECVVMRNQNHMELEDFKQLVESVKTYDPMENKKLEEELQELTAQISEKKAYIKKLKEGIEKLNVIEAEMDI